MKLYERDYSKLIGEEYADWQSLREQEVVGKPGEFEIRRSLFHKYPKAARHYISLFPNQYLDIVELKDEPRLNQLLVEFRALLDAAGASERKILNFINRKSAHFIVGAILKNNYRFGHHDAFLFPEFPLGTSYKADYLLIGKNSDGWSFVFV